MTDPRYLDATPEQMITDFWAIHYDNLRIEGKAEEIEDEDETFDQTRVEDLMERYPDSWMEHLDELEDDADDFEEVPL